jgi:hypothetical protein
VLSTRVKPSKPDERSSIRPLIALARWQAAEAGDDPVELRPIGARCMVTQLPDGER